MKKPFIGNFKITQNFNDPCCKESYFKFGLKGHNGIDYGLPCETKLISPISGEIKEVANDPTGYGLYIKIENSAEGCLLAHLSKQDIKIGQKVDEGQHLGWSGTTGNSTGCHLHFGYYRFPRDRTNGFNGYIDPISYFDSNDIIPPSDNMTEEQKRVLKFIEENKGLETNLESVIRAWFGAYKDLTGVLQERDNYKTANGIQANQITQLQKDLNICLISPSEAPKTVSEAFSLFLRLLFNK